MSARIEDVLAEHWPDASTGDKVLCAHDHHWRTNAVHREHVAHSLELAGFDDVAQARKDALVSAAEAWATGAWSDAFLAANVEDDVSAVRAMETWLIERAEDSPAPVECQECGETVRHSACSHEKDICPGCVGKCFHCVAEMESA